MSIYVPRTGRTFETLKSCVNHIRIHYPSIEEAYLDIYSVEPKPKCKWCGEDAKFISLRRGYRKTCCSKECVLKSAKEANQEIARKRIDKNRNTFVSGYDQFVSENLDLYVSVYRGSTKFVDQFDGQEIKSQVKETIRRKSESNLEAFSIDSVCLISGESYKHNPFFDRGVYGYKWTQIVNPKIKLVGSYIENHIGLKGVSLEDLYDFLIFWKSNRSDYLSKSLYEKIEFLLDCKIYERNLLSPVIFEPEVVSAVRRIKIGNLLPYKGLLLNRTKFRPGEFDVDNKDIPFVLGIGDVNSSDIHSECEVCGKTYRHSKIRYSQESGFFPVREGSDKICSRPCYHKALTKRDIFVNVTSEESKKKQSETLKKKIRSGEFTPCVTNSRCKSRVYSKNGTPFRSTWEAVFYSVMMLDGVDLENGFEEIRIPYETETGWSNYLVDFVDHSRKTLYEIKPESNKADCVAKEDAAKKWCDERSYTFEYVSDEWFRDNLKRHSLESIENYIEIDHETLLSRMGQFMR